MRMFFAAACAALALAGPLAGPPLPARASTLQAFDAGAGRHAAILFPDAQPAGSVILIPGGTTKLPIAPDGSGFERSANFVVRTRERYLSAGYAVALISDPSDLATLVQKMRTIARPVFFVGTSAGTVVEAANVTRLGADGPDGAVFTSSLTLPNRSMGRPVQSYPLDRIRVPVLLVHNANDGCPLSPPGGVATIAAAIAPALVSTIVVSSTESESAPCDALSPHGYLGIEDDTIAKILAWMDAHRTARAAPAP